MSASLQNEFISDTFTSLLHLSGGGLHETPKRDIYDGAGNKTGAALSGTKVIVNNVELPEQHVDSLEATNNGITSLVDMFFPIGSVQMTADNVSPQTRIPGTRWVRVAVGRFIVGVGGRNPSNDYIGYTAGVNIGGSDGVDSHVSLIEAQLPKHTHVPESYNSEFSNVVTWGTAGITGQQATGPVDQAVPNTGTDSLQPIYAFPATQPIAQQLSYVGNEPAQAFSISPVSYGVYVWRRVPWNWVDLGDDVAT